MKKSRDTRKLGKGQHDLQTHCLQGQSQGIDTKNFMITGDFGKKIENRFPKTMQLKENTTSLGVFILINHQNTSTIPLVLEMAMC